MPAEAGEGARHGAVDALGVDLAAGAEVHQPHRLAVAGLGEGVREGRTGVADALGEGLCAVQMAEGRVVDAVERPGGHGGHAADGDVAFAVAGCAADHEGVREDDGPGAVGPLCEVGPYAVERGGEDGFVARPRRLELVADQGRFEVGQPVEGDVAVGVAEHDGGGAAGRVGAQVDPGVVDEARADAEPAGRVVVSGDHHGRYAGLGEPVQRPVEQLDGGQRRHRPVVHVTRDEDSVHLVRQGGRHEVVEEGGLCVEKADPVEGPSQVPVRRVQESHDP